MTGTILEQKISTGTRLGSMLLDHMIMGFAAGLFLVPSIAVSIYSSFKEGGVMFEDGPGGLVYLSYLGFAIYLAKDCVQGRSPAKRLLELQVVKNSTGEPASPVRCVLRNFLCFLWPIEVLAALINPERKVGDYVAGTRLAPFNKNHASNKIDFWQIALALALAYGFTYIFMYPFSQLPY